MSQKEVLKEQLVNTVDTYVKYIDVDTGVTVRNFYLFQKLYIKILIFSGQKNQWRS